MGCVYNDPCELKIGKNFELQKELHYLCLIHPLIFALNLETVRVQENPISTYFHLYSGQKDKEVISGYDRYNQGIPDAGYILPIQVLKNSQRVSSNSTFRINLTCIRR